MCHVLIIEDEPFVAMHIEALLEEMGATSFAFAATEDEAVAAALESLPALITSDVRLVAGVGPAAVKKIIAEIGPIPVIFITATPAECTSCAPPMLVLSKPVSRDALAGAYHQLIDGDGVARIQIL